MIGKRIIAFIGALGLALGSVPIDVSAARFNINDSIHWDDYSMTLDIDIEMIANHRASGILDAGKIVDAMNRYKGDYKIDLRDEALELFQDYKFADLLEYEYFETQQRENVYIKTGVGTIPDYASKLEYLIENNIINRTTNFIYNDTGVYAGMGRQIHANLANMDDILKNELGDTSTTDEAKPRYFNPTLRISKTDFVTELMKINKVHTSRIIGVQSPYTRLEPNLVWKVVEFEDLETSPYQSYMGAAGIDGLTSDVYIDHVVFRQLNLLYTNDVVEMYLEDALKAGVIVDSDISGVVNGRTTEGQIFKNNRPTSTIAPPGSWHEQGVIRQFYEGGQEIQVADKNWETEEDSDALISSYSQHIPALEEARKNDAASQIVEQAEFSDGLAYPWGDSFAYSIDECDFGNPYSTQPVEIIKRFSVVDKNQGLEDKVRSALVAAGAQINDTFNFVDPGYQYFTNEDITLAEAYVLVHRFMLSAGEEPAISQQAIDFINSTYALDFGSLNGEELDAVKYLIAKGVLDPSNNNIKQSVSTQLTNEIAVDLLYRVHNKNQRMEFTPDLSEIDKDMLDRGYSKSQVSVQMPGQGTDASPLKYSLSVGGRQTAQGSPNTLSNMQLLDRIRNPFDYDYIYVMYPEGTFKLSEGVERPEQFSPETYNDLGAWYLASSIKLIVNTDMRMVQDPYNYRLNGGVSEPMQFVDNGDGTGLQVPSYLQGLDVAGGEVVYDTDNRFVYKDRAGNFWGRYIVPKGSSNNLRLVITSEDGRVSEYTGFQGEGVYYLRSGSDSKFAWLSLSDAERSRVAGNNNSPESAEASHNLYRWVISNDLLTRTFLSSPEQPITSPEQLQNELNRINGDLSGPVSVEEESTLLSLVHNIIPFDGLLLGVQAYAPRSHVSYQNVPTVMSLGLRRFGAQEPASFKMGPLDRQSMENLTYNGQPLVKTVGDTYEIDTVAFSNQLSAQKKLKYMTIEPAEDGKFIVNYTPIGSNVAVEVSELIGAMDMNVSGDVASQFPGYSKITFGGQQLTLISKDELTGLSQAGLHIEALSDKLLWNKTTGQRAFLNTDENFTLIGNNITKYPSGTVMVVSLGDRVYYNLDVVMELLNDVNAVARQTGKEIFISSSVSGTMSDVIEYQLAKVYDGQYGTYIDQTYYMSDTGGVYLSLSSLADKASNFIYFKDVTVPGLELLITYFPKITTDTVKHFDVGANGYDNGVLGSMSVQRDLNEGFSDLTNQKYEGTTAVLSAYLFGGGGGENATKPVEPGNSATIGQASSGVLPSGYHYNIYFLTRENSTDFNETVWADFVRNFQDISVRSGMSKYTGDDALNEAIMDPTISVQGASRNSKSEQVQADLDSTNLTFSLLITSADTLKETNRDTGKIIFQNSANNNLFFRLINSDGSTNHLSYAELFKNRFWAQAELDSGGKVQTNASLAVRDGAPVLMFRQQEYYFKTHEGSVPLELFANGQGWAGRLNLDRSSETESRINDYRQLANGNSPDFKVSLIRPQVSQLGKDMGMVSGIGTNLLVPFPSSIKDASTGARDDESYYDVALFTSIKAEKKVLSGDLFSSWVDSATKGKYATVPELFIRHMITEFESNYQPTRVDDAGLKKFAAEASIQRARYNHLALVNDMRKLSRYNENVLPYLGTLAQLSENTWDLLDYERSSLFYELPDRGNSPAPKPADSLVTFSLSDNPGAEYVATFHVGVPPEDMVNKIVERHVSHVSQGVFNGTLKPSDIPFIRAAEQVFSNWTNQDAFTANAFVSNLFDGGMRTYAGYDDTQYSKMDSGFAFFAITKVDRNNPASSQLMGLAKLDANAVLMTNIGNTTATGEALLQSMWQKAWSHSDSFLYVYDQSRQMNTVQNSASLIKSWDAFAGACSNGEGTIYYQPTLALPAGSTLVDQDGNLDTVVAPRIRNKINFCGDIINSVLARLMLDIEMDNIMFLAEVPKYSIVVFPGWNASSTGGIFYKTSDEVVKPEGMSWDNTRLNQVSLMMDIEASGMRRYREVNDYTMAFSTLLSVYNMEIPTTGSGGDTSVNSSRLKLGSVMGNGLWRLPYTQEVQGIVEKTSRLKKANQAPTNMLETFTQNSINFLGQLPLIGSFIERRISEDSIKFWSYPSTYDNLIGSDPSSWNSETAAELRAQNITVDIENKSISTETVPYMLTRNGSEDYRVESVIRDSQGLFVDTYAYIMPVIDFPPTIVVEKDPSYEYYTVKYYVDPAIYSIDVNNNYINYLKTRNTPAYSPTAALEGVRGTSMDGYTYKGYAMSITVDNFVANLMGFVRWAIPAGLLFMWTIVTFMFCFTQLVPATQYIIGSASVYFATDLTAKLTLGLLSGERRTSLLMYFIYSTLIWTLASLLAMNYLQTSLMITFEWLIHRTSGGM